MNELFENIPVNISELPDVAKSEYHGIEKAYLTVTRISNSILFSVLIIGAFCIIFFNDDINNIPLNYAISIGPLMLFWILSLLFVSKAFPKKKYSLREKDIIYTKGLLWNTRTSIPFNRIQHAEVKQGPIDRMFKLHSLKVFTAGGDSSDLVIPGLSEEKANKIKEFIMGKTALDDSGS